MKAIIMAAGKSTRTYPLTLTQPKPLLRVADKTILEHQLDALRGVVDGVIVIVGYRQEMVRDRFGACYGDIPITYVEQTDQLGTGHAVLQCARAVTEPFLVMNGDDLYDPQDLRAVAAVEQGALVKTIDDPALYGVYEVDENDCATRLVEKPAEYISNLANVGVYKLPVSVFDILEKTERSERNEIELTSAVDTLARQSAFNIVRMHGYWWPIGYPWHLLDANQYMLDNCLEPGIHTPLGDGVHIRGKVYIGAGTVVMPGTVIDGPVYVGKNSKLGPNCWLRPYTTLGDGCRVGQGSETKNVVFFDGAAAPHQNYVGDSVLGEKVNLGCGTVTANLRHDNANVKSMVKGELIDTGRRKCGAFIGDHVHTGIHTGIYPGRKIWSGLGTRPGQIVDRDLVDE